MKKTDTCFDKVNCGSGIAANLPWEKQSPSCPVLETLRSPYRSGDQSTFPTSQSAVQLLPISLYPGAAAGSTSGFSLLLGFPPAAVQASNVGDKALVAADVYNPWHTPLLSSLLARGLTPVDLPKHGTTFCWNKK